MRAIAFLFFLSATLAAEERARKTLEFQLDGTTWRALQTETGQAYYVNSNTGQSQWNDPRRVAASGQETLTTFLIFMLPFLLMAVAGGAYLMYIRMAHPDVLKTPKKAKAKHVHSLAQAAKKSKHSPAKTPTIAAAD